MIRSLLSRRWMLLGLALAGSPTALAHGPDGHHPPDRPYVPATVIPETLPQVVVALRSAHASAQVALAAGKLTDAAPHAQALIDLALAVPTKIAGLSWTSDGGPVTFDFHGEPKGAPPDVFQSYATGSEPRAEGKFVAPFEGIHGWYWKNTNPAPVTIRVTTSGTYTSLSRR